MNTTKKIAYNSLASLGLRALYVLASLLIVGLMTRYLGRTTYGEYATVLAIVYVFAVLADLGLYNITLRDIARPGADEQKIIQNNFTIRFLAGLFLFGGGALLVWFLPYPSLVKKGVLVAGAGFWLLSNINVLIGVFQKHLRVDKVAVTEFLGRLFQLALVFYLIQKGAGFLTLVAALAAGSLLNFILIWYFLRPYAPLKLRFDFGFWRQTLKQSLPLGVASIFVMIYFKLDTVMLSLMKTPADVGLYSVAYKVLENFVFLPTMLIGLIMPLLAKYFVANFARFRRVADTTQRIFLLVAIPLTLGGVFLAKQIIYLLAGSDFAPAASALRWLMVALSLIFLGALYSNMLIAANLQKKLTLVYGVGAVVNLALNLVFIPRFSYNGAAATTVFTELLVTFLMFLFLARQIKFRPSFRSAWPPLLAGAAMAVFLFFFQAWPFWALVVGGSLIYGAFLYFSAGVRREDLRLIFSKNADNQKT
ncbi:MAG: hypothetical protein COU85_01695 [Candidatus Portnoybacteria bacterium CG10_big_fil_rev_8_21_14_0_10_44_7]|uniref:Uncharacterized protein n=1 Tax=Candidatus Portnoybacteria bacterium CG10_big_fil_rev_8_21_14_0_10_44_7 TaxID=1974816 RepID=A0A2M8KIQ6_9BACT|nr:MAG: hypothetical protein COU85_01695 [Candidatus Portnoybacteria bacterium CG10_big_fil_rev_8_21_14_0_10_44_7]